jgi:hypothetical protein
MKSPSTPYFRTSIRGLIVGRPGLSIGVAGLSKSVSCPARTIGFGSYLSWECRKGVRDEFDIDELQQAGRMAVDFFSAIAGADPIADADAEQARSIYRTWTAILLAYSKTSLTIGTDKYAALLGVISAIKRRTGWPELAGIWKHFLLVSLLWSPSVLNPTSGTPRRTGLSPSWSWISIECDLSLPQMEGNIEELATANWGDLAAQNPSYAAGSKILLAVSGFMMPLAAMTEILSRCSTFARMAGRRRIIYVRRTAWTYRLGR